jgi:hypothetical protein
MSKKMPSDNDEIRKLNWMNTLKLNNFRRRIMFVGQIGSVFVDDIHLYPD